jgi:hypothetical protein
MSIQLVLPDENTWLRQKIGKKASKQTVPFLSLNQALSVMVRWRGKKSWPTFIHILSDNVDRFLRYHCIQLDQLVMFQLLHDLCFLEEWFRRHCAWFKSLYGYFCVSIPGTYKYPIMLSQTRVSSHGKKVLTSSYLHEVRF